MKIQNVFLAAVLAATPFAGAIAQSVAPDVKAGSQSEAAMVRQGSATDTRKPGATGSSVVPGDNSTVAGDQKATDRAKTGGGGTGGSK